ncbi:hypothetical protein GCM10023185_15590 [Hymenobacter saemangeumensis]|uniref:Uncharacterized protein n=1 Tax=Hymenobacter saemangeumensis TaxID=1084522 RepID=A0ABP8I9W2_9BACT
MSEKAQRLLKLLTQGPHPVKTGVVTSVNLQELTCDVDPDDEGAELVGVRLRTIADDGAVDGFTVIPKVGSSVTLLMLDEDTAVVVQASTAQLLTLATENESLKAILKDTFAAIGRMSFQTNNGATLQLLNAPEFTALDQRLDLLFKN